MKKKCLNARFEKKNYLKIYKQVICKCKALKAGYYKSITIVKVNLIPSEI